MEFEEQEEQEEEIEIGGNYESPLGNSSRPKMAGSPADQRKPKYRECLKNHAVGIGGHAVDGCREFMPAGPEGSLDALKCAACNCHRNFHRKDSDSGAGVGGGGGEAFSFPPHYHHPHPHPHPHQQFSPYYRTPAGYLHVAPYQRPLALPSTSGGGGGGSHSREEQEDISNPTNNSGGGGGGSSKKRFRTKFTQEQKDRMLGLAERLGWRIQKQDEAVVQQFCDETGVKRHVLKVWMHNNKHTLGKKP